MNILPSLIFSCSLVNNNIIVLAMYRNKNSWPKSNILDKLGWKSKPNMDIFYLILFGITIVCSSTHSLNMFILIRVMIILVLLVAIFSVTTSFKEYLICKWCEWDCYTYKTHHIIITQIVKSASAVLNVYQKCWNPSCPSQIRRICLTN